MGEGRFAFTGGVPGSSTGALWGRGAVSRFDGRFTGTPVLGFGLSDATREAALGWHLTEVPRGGLAFALDVEGVRQDRTAGDGEAGHRLAFGLGWRLDGMQARELQFLRRAQRHQRGQGRLS